MLGEKNYTLIPSICNIISFSVKIFSIKPFPWNSSSSLQTNTFNFFRIVTCLTSYLSTRFTSWHRAFSNTTFFKAFFSVAIESKEEKKHFCVKYQSSDSDKNEYDNVLILIVTYEHLNNYSFSKLINQQ